MDIQEQVKNTIDKFITDGTVEEIIEVQVKKTVESICNDLFRDYSDFGKELKKALTDKLVISLDNLDIASYQTMVCNSIEEVVAGTVLKSTKAKIFEVVNNITGKLEKTNWKLSEIIAKYRESLTDSPELVYEAEEKYSIIWISIGEKVEKNSYSSYSLTQSYEVRLAISQKNNKVFSCTVDDKVLDPRISKIYRHNFESLLMNLWAQDCTIELDYEDCEYECTRDYND